MILGKIFAIPDLFISPTEYFSQLKSRPQWILLFLIIAIITIVVGYFLLPYKQEIILSSLSEKLGKERAHQTLTMVNQFAVIGLFMVPIPMLLKWLVIAMLLYYIAILFNSSEIKFNETYAVVVHAEAILLIASVLQLAVLMIDGTHGIINSTIVHSVIGLDNLRNNESGDIIISTLLKNLNLITIWYYSILFIRLSIISRLEKWKSITIVVLLWSLGIIFQVATKYLTTNYQQMLGR